MGSETEQIRKDIEVKREEMLGTVMEIGERVAIPRTTFIAGMITGVVMLATLNRIQFRRPKKG